MKTETKQTPKWEFNGEFLVSFGSALTPKGREDVLIMLDAYEDHERYIDYVRLMVKDGVFPLTFGEWKDSRRRLSPSPAPSPGRTGGEMRFRKKPVVIEAMKYDGENAIEIMKWAHEGLPPEANSIIWKQIYSKLGVRTLEGTMSAVVGDWIIKGVKGEFYPCRPDIFDATYEPEEPQKPR